MLTQLDLNLASMPKCQPLLIVFVIFQAIGTISANGPKISKNATNKSSKFILLKHAYFA